MGCVYLLMVLAIETKPLLEQAKQDEVIQLSALDIDVRVEGFLAETKLTVTLSNTGRLGTSGEYILRLPKGAGVTGYRLLVNEKYVDGVVTDKDTARIVFERETRRRIDPGLVEWVDGTHYRTRVFPILPGKTRTFQISYVAPLVFADRFMSLELPLRGVRAGSLRLSVQAENASTSLSLYQHPFQTNLSFSNGSAEVTAQHFYGDRNLVLRGRLTSQTLMVDPAKGYHFLSLQKAPRPKRSIELNPSELLIFWDASYSRQDADHHTAIQYVTQMLQRMPQARVALTLFRNTVEPPVVFEAGQIDAITKFLNGLVYDGGTNLVDLVPPDGFSPDATLLITDGMGNFSGQPELEAPLLVFNPSSQGNHARLSGLVRQVGGVYQSLDGSNNAAEGIDKLMSPWWLKHLQSQGQTQLRHASPAAGWDLISGLSPVDAAEMTAVYGGVGGRDRKRKLKLNPSRAVSSRLVRIYNRILELHDLARFPMYNRTAIKKLARRAGLVSPHTSLLSLERLEQYVAYQIEPPLSRPEWRAAWFAKMGGAGDLNEEALEFAELVLLTWEERLHLLNREHRPGPRGDHSKSIMAVDLALKYDMTLWDKFQTSGGDVNPYYENLMNASLDSVDPDQPYVKLVDRVGRPIPNQLLCLIANDRSLARELVSDSNGLVSLAGLPLLAYELQIPNPFGHASEFGLDLLDGFHQGEILWMEDRDDENPHLFTHGPWRKGEWDVQFLIGPWVSEMPQTLSVMTIDQFGQYLPGVEVTLTSADGGEVVELKTNDMGFTNSPVLPADNYQVKAQLMGFQTAYAYFSPRNDKPSKIEVLLKHAGVYESMVISPSASAVSDQTWADLNPWPASVDYLEVLSERGPAAWLELRETHAARPDFFFTSAQFFFQNGLREQGFCAISSLLEMGWDDPQILKAVARVYMEQGDLDTAARLFEKVSELQPELPHSFRDLALIQTFRADEALAAGDRQTANQLYDLALNILSRTIARPWGPVSDSLVQAYLDDDPFSELMDVLITEFNWIIQKRRRAGFLGPVPNPYAGMEVEGIDLVQSVEADLRIVLDWDNDWVDLDMMVQEAWGEVVNYRNSPSQSGGFIANAHAEGFGPETYTVKHADPGIYRIMVCYRDVDPSVRVGPITATATIFQNYGRANETRIRHSLRLDWAGQLSSFGTIEVKPKGPVP